MIAIKGNILYKKLLTVKLVQLEHFHMLVLHHAINVGQKHIQVMVLPHAIYVVQDNILL